MFGSCATLLTIVVALANVALGAPAHDIEVREIPPDWPSYLDPQNDACAASGGQ